MGGKSGRNEREATRVEGIIAGLSSWRRGWYRPQVEAVKKAPVRSRIVGGSRRKTTRSRCVLRGWRTPSHGTDTRARHPLGVHDEHHRGDSDRPQRLRQRPDLHGARGVTTPGRSAAARQRTAGEAAPVFASSGRPRLNAGKHRNRRLREKASRRRFQAKHALRERPAT